jgi:hypothetical protein
MGFCFEAWKVRRYAHSADEKQNDFGFRVVLEPAGALDVSKLNIGTRIQKL